MGGEERRRAARAREIRHRRLGPAGGRVARARGGAGRNGTHRPARPTPRLGGNPASARPGWSSRSRARERPRRGRARGGVMRSPGRGQRGRQRWSSRAISRTGSTIQVPHPTAQVPVVVSCSRWRRETLTPTDAPRARVRAALPPAPARDASRARRPARGHPAPRRRPLARGASRRPPRASRGASRAPAPDRAPTGRFASENEPSRLPPPGPLHDARASAARPAPGPDRAARAARRSPSPSPRAPRAGTASSRGREPPKRSPDPRAMFFFS